MGIKRRKRRRRKSLSFHQRQRQQSRPCPFQLNLQKQESIPRRRSSSAFSYLPKFASPSEEEASERTPARADLSHLLLPPSPLLLPLPSYLQRSKIETAAAFKAKGNAFFKAVSCLSLSRFLPSLFPSSRAHTSPSQGENLNAIREYHSALTFLKGLNRAVMGMDTGDADSKKKMSEVDVEISVICELSSA